MICATGRIWLLLCQILSLFMDNNNYYGVWTSHTLVQLANPPLNEIEWNTNLTADQAC